MRTFKRLSFIWYWPMRYSYLINQDEQQGQGFLNHYHDKDTALSSAGRWGCSCWRPISAGRRPTAWPPRLSWQWGPGSCGGPWKWWRSSGTPPAPLCSSSSPQTGGPFAPLRCHQEKLRDDQSCKCYSKLSGYHLINELPATGLMTHV